MRLAASLAALVALAAIACSAKPAAKPLEVVLYGEGGCPYCKAFIENAFGKTVFDRGLADAVAFRYVAWGNAQNTPDGVSCQHGPKECKLNRLINCAQHITPALADWFPFVRCVEDPHSLGKSTKYCANLAGLDVGALFDCAEGAQGDELEVAAARETDALHPPHEYVPWVTVNGVPLGEDDDNIATFICVAYEGDRPDVCFEPPQAPKLGSGRSLRDGPGAEPEVAAS